ncbi:MAG: sigma-70 family RNA polymerase sigma factor [Opitutaceae bacterium]
MKPIPMPGPPASELSLLTEARLGGQVAYGKLVARHQTLVVSIAYSICGDFARSQDIAQEAFIAAWQQLPTIADPTKFKGWLCGITRNLAHNFTRQQTRRRDRPIAAGEFELDPPASGPGPHEQAVTREESMIVWRALEQLPEAYREPLILFYREHHSVERVAAALDLSEDTVKQRLSRGRGMLRDRVESLIDRSLGFTTPGAMFTIAVVSALPAATLKIAAASVAGAAAKSGASTKAVGILPWLSGLLTPFLALPFISLAVTSLLSRRVGRSNRPPPERKFLRRLVWSDGIIDLVVLFGLVALGSQSFTSLSMTQFTLVSLGLMGIAVFGPLLTQIRSRRRLRDITRNAELPVNASPWRKKIAFVPRRAQIYRSRFTAFGLPLIDIRFGHSADEPLVRGTAVGWIALGDIAHGVILAVGGFAVGGIAVGRVAFGALSIGYSAFGLVALGGIAVGGLAKGILLAVGYIALGTVAIGWEGASGLASVAKHLASGGIAFGESVVPQEWVETNPIVRAFKLNLILAIPLFAILNALIAGLGSNLLARDRRRSRLKPVFVGLLTLTVAGYALIFKTAIDRATRELAAEREVVDHAKARFELGQRLAKTGNPAEALAEFLWCVADGKERKASLNDLSAIFSSIYQLNTTYPPAKDALRNLRDYAESAIRSGHTGKAVIMDVWEVSTLNLYLDDARRAQAFYDELPPTNKARAYLARQPLIQP